MLYSTVEKTVDSLVESRGFELKRDQKGGGWIKVVVLYVSERRVLGHTVDSSGNKKSKESIYVQKSNKAQINMPKSN